MNSKPPLTRRDALSVGSATILGAGVLTLTACSSDAGGRASGPSLPEGTAIAKLSDIPVGGTASANVDGHPLLLAQPEEGSVVCFSAICTHQGCTVNAAPTDFECPCHGSTYAAADGTVTHGPAPKALAEIPVTVSGEIVVSA